MRISIIAALDRNRVIGHRGGIPWRLPADLKQFKRRTLGHALVMGRKTWESLPKRLEDRTLLVVTRTPHYDAPGAHVVDSVGAALERANELGAGHVFIAGGSQIYEVALEYADELILTHVDTDAEGDTYFPRVDFSRWTVAEHTDHPPDERHPYPFRVVVYKRRRSLRPSEK